MMSATYSQMVWKKCILKFTEIENNKTNVTAIIEWIYGCQKLLMVIRILGTVVPKLFYKFEIN